MPNYLFISKMHRSKKAMLEAEELPGIITLIIIAFISLFIFHSCNSFDQQKKQGQIEASLDQLNVNSNLDYFLRFQVDGDKTIADIISQSYTGNDYQQLKIIFNKYFADIYDSKGISYDLMIGRVTLNSINFIGEVKEASIELPLLNKDTVTITLLVGKAGVVQPV